MRPVPSCPTACCACRWSARASRATTCSATVSRHPTGVTTWSDDDLAAYRVVHGVPAMGHELDDATIPAEVGQWIVDESVSFTKGCFVGQELVARIDSRGGNVPRRLRVLVMDEAVHEGMAVEADGPAGNVTTAAVSAVHGPVALGVLRSGGRAGDTGTRRRRRRRRARGPARLSRCVAAWRPRWWRPSRWPPARVRRRACSRRRRAPRRPHPRRPPRPSTSRPSRSIPSPARRPPRS